MRYCNLRRVPRAAPFRGSSLLAASPLASQYKALFPFPQPPKPHSLLPSAVSHFLPIRSLLCALGLMCVLPHECSNSIFCPTWLAGAPLKLTVNLNTEPLSVGSYFFPSQHIVSQRHQPVSGSGFQKKKKKIPCLSLLGLCFEFST